MYERQAAGRQGPYSPGGEGPATRTGTSTQAAAPASTDTVVPQFTGEMAQLQQMLTQGIAQGFALGVQALRDSKSGHASTGATAVDSTGPPVIQPPAPLQDAAEVVFPSLPGRQDTSTLANPIDSFVPPKLRDRIWNKDFVDLLNLIQEEPEPAKFSIDSTGSSPSITMIAPSKRVVTSILQWIQAFRRYTAVYMQKWPQEVQGLLKHAKVVQGLHEERCDWRTYDTRFRHLHAYGREVYGHINIDLYATATQPPRARQPAAEWQGPDKKGGKMQGGTVEGVLLSTSAISVDRPTQGPTNRGSTTIFADKGLTVSDLQMPTNRNDRGPPLLKANSRIGNSPVNIDVFRKYLHGYDLEKSIYLTNGFTQGFSIEFQGEKRLSIDDNNPRLPADLVPVMEQKVREEIRAGRIKGPFSSPPLQDFRVSSIKVVPKKTPGSFRFIHNLIFPYDEGMSVNSSIPRDRVSVRYCTLDDAIAHINQVGKGAWLAKTDIKSAFRIIPITPAEHHLLGFTWLGKFYYDTTLPMGCSMSCSIFEAFSTAIQSSRRRC